ncbi:MAG: hypothetical protein OXE17_02965 [Chloroflexi bacterium]|nr:hypothetical protein [Chloroflexota bacterium]
MKQSRLRGLVWLWEAAERLWGWIRAVASLSGWGLGSVAPLELVQAWGSVLEWGQV